MGGGGAYSDEVGAGEELMRVEGWGVVEVGTIRNCVNMLQARNSPARLSSLFVQHVLIHPRWGVPPSGHALPPVPAALLPNTSSSSLLSAPLPPQIIGSFHHGHRPSCSAPVPICYCRLQQSPAREPTSTAALRRPRCARPSRCEDARLATHSEAAGCSLVAWNAAVVSWMRGTTHT